VAYEAARKPDEAIADDMKAISLKSDESEPYMSLAWLYSVYPDAKYRDGKKAIENAKLADQYSRGRMPRVLNMLALSHAEAGLLPQAIQFEQRYLQTPDISPRDAAQAKDELLLFQQGKPFIESPFPVGEFH
jgi:hypothetical protein